jgi:hypothetical protein
MTKNSAPKKKPTGNYAVGYAKTPESGKFVAGKSGHPAGRPKGRPSSSQLFLEELARIVKVKIGDEIVPLEKERALYRKLIDLSIMGNIPAARTVVMMRDRAAADLGLAPDLEAPLTPEELAVLKMMKKPVGG